MCNSRFADYGYKGILQMVIIGISDHWTINIHESNFCNIISLFCTKAKKLNTVTSDETPMPGS